MKSWISSKVASSKCFSSSTIRKRNFLSIKNTQFSNTFLSSNFQNIPYSKKKKFSSIKSFNSFDSNFEAVIGLEIHLQISSLRKLFSRGSAGISGKLWEAPNTRIGLTDIAFPGTLPVYLNFFLTSKFNNSNKDFE